MVGAYFGPITGLLRALTKLIGVLTVGGGVPIPGLLRAYYGPITGLTNLIGVLTVGGEGSHDLDGPAAAPTRHVVWHDAGLKVHGTRLGRCFCGCL